MSESDPNTAAERPDATGAATPPPPNTPPIDTTPPEDGERLDEQRDAASKTSRTEASRTETSQSAPEADAPFAIFDAEPQTESTSADASTSAEAPTAAPADGFETNAAPTTPIAPSAPATPPPADPATQSQPQRRFGAGMLLASLAVGALVGGASGAGVTAWLSSMDDNRTQTGTSTPQNITITDTDNVNVVNAVAAKASPSVVKISVASNSGGGTGSGVILSEDGYILTNAHVVTLDGAAGDATIEVETTDGALLEAEVVGIDPTVDLAVIQVQDASGLTPIEWGDSSALDVGDQVVAIGAPLGLENTVTDGIVSALNRSIDIESSAAPEGGEQPEPDPDDPPFNFDIPGQQGSGGALISIPVIQTDAAINPGNSGGALVNERGQLVGINVAIATPGGVSTNQSGSVGVGFAIPSTLAQRVAEELIEDGRASHGLLGASVRDATSQDGTVVGAYVAEVVPDGAADAAGLEVGDVITEFNGIRITDRVDITAQVRLLPGGAEAELTYVRGGDEQTVTVTLGELGT